MCCQILQIKRHCKLIFFLVDRAEPIRIGRRVLYGVPPPPPPSHPALEVTMLIARALRKKTQGNKPLNKTTGLELIHD